MAIHPTFVHFHTGILAAVAAVVMINMLLRLMYREAIRTPGTRMAKIFHELDIFIFWGNIIGLIGLIAGMVTGFMEPSWPIDVLLADPIMRFKILWSIVATELYIFLVVVRAKVGDRIWVKRSTFLIYGIITVIGGMLMVFMGALGGVAVYGESILDPLLNWLGLPWP